MGSCGGLAVSYSETRAVGAVGFLFFEISCRAGGILLRGQVGSSPHSDRPPDRKPRGATQDDRHNILLRT